MTVFKTALLSRMEVVFLTGLALMWNFLPLQASAELGRQVDNVASVSASVADSRVSFDTNTASFIIEARRTESEIQFYRYAPQSENSVPTRLNGSDYNPSGELPPKPTLNAKPLAEKPNDGFIPIGPPRTTGGKILDFSGDVKLRPAAKYIVGELMIVGVSDSGQNGQPNKIETLITKVSTSAGDSIFLRLYESGPDTGEFFAYFPSSRKETAPGDNTLTAPGNVQLTATYEDAFDSTEVSIDTALVDPFGRVFDSVSGEFLDGVNVTIVDAITGQPAPVFGIDGISDYPSVIVTGEPVTDESGFLYELEPGEFLFPLMAPGDYRLIVEAPEFYLFPSSFAAENFASIANAPFEIIGGSYGEVFTVEATDPINFDVPLDIAAELVVSKTANAQTASIGDTVGYTIEVFNRDDVPVPMRIQDRLPPGLRYLDGSIRADSGSADVTSVSTDGRTIEMSGGILAPGDTVRLTYAATVSAGTKRGEAINKAHAVNINGERISNRTEAAVTIIEDLLRSRMTVIGRVAENACKENQHWARQIEDGLGVAGVRLYMETGEYVVSDSEGLFHFEGVKPGTHVVQLDEETLPQGYTPMICEENSRYAGSATSKFVDATGGTIWRANFYLKRVSEIATEAQDEIFDDAVEYQQFDTEWLDAAEATPRWVYPETTRTPSSHSVNIGIAHPQRHSVELSLNGQPVSGLNFSGRDSAATGPAAISRWRGLDILDGENTFIARIKSPTGEIVDTLEESIWYVVDSQRARLVQDQSDLVADGITAPIIAVRIEDAAGRPVHKGRTVRVDVSDPYFLEIDTQFEAEAAISANTLNIGVTVGPDGVARIALQPTLKTGRARLTVHLDNGRTQDIDVYLTPEKRDWIVVGLAEGHTGLQKLDGNTSGSDTIRDGRVAFFAKGLVKGDWLLTLAVDTAKRRGDRDGTIFEDYIDPNAYYTLYGDQSYQYSDAESRYPVYVKLEKDTYQLLFGDFNTDLDETELGRYVRRLSGLKGIYAGKYASGTGFVAETNQNFVKDEIAADGTSGPYRLSVQGTVRNSELITVETRDRERPDIVVDVRNYTRNLDYEIDYFTGEVIFRHPVNLTDSRFNPNIIVADYEVSEDAKRNVTLGGRVAAYTADRRFEAGATYVREEGADAASDGPSDIAALDLTARLSETTELHAEVATSSRETTTGTDRANAYLLEAVRETEALKVTGYLREDEEGFGLGQQGSNTIAARRVGADVIVSLSESVSEKTGRRTERFFDGEVYHEENLATDATRFVSEAQVRQENQSFGLAAGLKGVQESYADGEERSSLLATIGARKSFTDLGLTISAAHEQPVAASSGEATAYPERTQLNVDKTLTKWATLNLSHEVNNGPSASGQNTIAGVTVTPWAGGEVRASADAITQDSSQRLGATIGVDQSFQINEAWTTSIGAARRARVDGGDEPRDVLADTVSVIDDGVRSSLINDDTYTSAYGGVGYRTDTTAGSGRLEHRSSELGDRRTAALGAAREVSEKLSFAAAARVHDETIDDGADRMTGEARIGAAYRPRGEGVVIYNRLDATYQETEDEITQHKLVNNFGANMMMTERTQAAVFYGLKYQESEIGEIETSGFTQLVGGEVRHDITKRFDVGVSASALIDHETETTDYAFGPSIGFTPSKNVWVSVGYNIAGFTDGDFQDAEYSREGVYLKLRVKFDHHTAAGFLEKISPEELK